MNKRKRDSVVIEWPFQEEGPFCQHVNINILLRSYHIEMFLNFVSSSSLLTELKAQQKRTVARKCITFSVTCNLHQSDLNLRCYISAATGNKQNA